MIFFVIQSLLNNHSPEGRDHIFESTVTVNVKEQSMLLVTLHTFIPLILSPQGHQTNNTLCHICARPRNVWIRISVIEIINFNMREQVQS